MYVGMIPTMVGGRCQNRCLVFAILAMNGIWNAEFLLLLSGYGLFSYLFLSTICISIWLKRNSRCSNFAVIRSIRANDPNPLKGAKRELSLSSGMNR